MPPCPHRNVQIRILPCVVAVDAQDLAGSDNLLLRDQVCDDCGENVPFPEPATVDADVLDEIMAARLAAEAGRPGFFLARLGRRHRRIHDRSVEHGWRVASFERRSDDGPRSIILPDYDLGWLACEISEEIKTVERDEASPKNRPAS